MKGRYGTRMTIYGSVLPGAVSLANWAARTNLTPKAKQKLKVVDWMRVHQNNVSLTARRFGLNRETVRILKRKDMIVSASTIGRILKKKGLIDKKVSRKRYKAAKNPKQRYPRGLRITCEGDMVQIDTKFVTLLGGRMIYQFTAIDVLSKRRVLRYYSSLLSKNGADFLKVCLEKFPFQNKAVQTDNGKEFLKDFDALCKKLSLTHYFIEPAHPKQNTYVENSHGSDEREFYQQGNVHKDIALMDASLEQWEHIWNYERPHQALQYLTPDEYLQKIQLTSLPVKDVIVLQT